MRFARIVFTVAGMYGIVVLVPPLFLESKFGRDYPRPSPTRNFSMASSRLELPGKSCS